MEEEKQELIKILMEIDIVPLINKLQDEHEKYGEVFIPLKFPQIAETD